jgi:hypothetical protein
MKLADADIVWTPVYPADVCTRDEVPDQGMVRIERHSSGWKRTRGDRWMPAGDFSNGNGKTADLQLLAMFVTFNTITVRDGVDVQVAHQAFLAIDEYQQHISPDMEGADD